MALPIALIMLLLIALVATASTQVGQLELFMAGNAQAHNEALQRSLAAVDAILDDADTSMPVIGDVDHVTCRKEHACDAPLLDLGSDPGLPDEERYSNYSVTRLAPLETAVPVMDDTMASSSVAYRVARFEVSATYDDTQNGQGSATVTQGVLYKLAAPAQ